MLPSMIEDYEWTKVVNFGVTKVQGVIKPLLYFYTRYFKDPSDSIYDKIMIRSSCNKLPESSLYGTDVEGLLGYIDEDCGNILVMDDNTCANFINAMKSITDTDSMVRTDTLKMFVDGRAIDLDGIDLIYDNAPSNYGGDVVVFNGFVIDDDLGKIDKGMIMTLDVPTVVGLTKCLNDILAAQNPT